MTKRISNPVSELQGLWPSYKAFAEEVGVTEVRAQLWRHRSSIPSEEFPKIVKAAESRGLAKITYEFLYGLKGIGTSQQASA